MYRVRIERKAQKKLVRIPEPYYSKIKIAIFDLAKNPRPVNYKKLKGRNAYRVRVADYRIIYEIQDKILLVSVINLGHRKAMY